MTEAETRATDSGATDSGAAAQPKRRAGKAVHPANGLRVERVYTSPERPTMRIQLLDAGNTIVAQTGRVSVDDTTGNPSLSVAGVLLTDAGAPYDAVAGTYTLRMWGDNFGACTGFGQYQQPELTHIELAAGN